MNPAPVQVVGIRNGWLELLNGSHLESGVAGELASQGGSSSLPGKVDVLCSRLLVFFAHGVRFVLRRVGRKSLQQEAYGSLKRGTKWQNTLRNGSHNLLQ